MKWEYSVCVLEDGLTFQSYRIFLESMGDKGWQIADQLKNGAGVFDLIVIFQRPKQ